MPKGKYNTEPLLGTKKRAEHLSVTHFTVSKCPFSGKIPCHQVGKLWKFKAREIDSWVINGGTWEEKNNVW